MLKFLADEMLKKLAQWLRIVGLNVEYEYVVGRSDRQIMNYAKRKNLVLLTRDLKMVPSLRKRRVKFLLIESTNTAGQIAQVLSNYGYKINFPKNTRCPECNGKFRILKKIKREDVPPNVYAKKRKFWRCKKCRKIYWKGGHWKNMEKMIEKVKEIMKIRGGSQPPSNLWI